MVSLGIVIVIIVVFILFQAVIVIHAFASQARSGCSSVHDIRLKSSFPPH